MKVFIFLLFQIKGISTSNTIQKTGTRLVREGEHATVQCLGDKKVHAHTFEWIDHEGKSALRKDMLLLGNGSMVLATAHVSHTSVYKCTAETTSHKKIVMWHALYVYRVASCLMEYPLTYRVGRCGGGKVKRGELLQTLCGHFTSLCPFTAETFCQMPTPVKKVAKLSLGVTEKVDYDEREEVEERNETLLTIYLRLHPLHHFMPLDCDVECLKEQYNRHFSNIAGNLIQEIISNEANRSNSEYGQMHFDKEATLSGSRMVASCGRGFELREDIICMPCQLGHYSDGRVVRHVSKKLKHDGGTCKKCAAGTFQNKYAASFCKPCPHSSPVSVVAATSLQDCKGEASSKNAIWSWKLTTLICLFLLFFVSVILLILVLMVSPCLRNCSKYPAYQAVPVSFPP